MTAAWINQWERPRVQDDPYGEAVREQVWEYLDLSVFVKRLQGTMASILTKQLVKLLKSVFPPASE